MGELNPDFILSGLSGSGPVLGTEQQATGYQLVLGSATALCTVALARLGMRTAMVARVGDDEYGRLCLGWLAREGVDASGVIIDPHVATGLTVALAYPADRMLLTVPGTMPVLTAADLPVGLLDRARHLHVSSYFLQTGLQTGLPALLQIARQRGLTTSLDTGWDPAGAWMGPGLRAALAHIDVFLPNENELAALGGSRDLGQAAATILAAGAARVVVKRGPAGATMYDGRTSVEVAGFEMAAVDTTGAGDNFNGGFLFGFLCGWPAKRCLRLGNACGALSVRAVGGVGGYTGLANVEAFAAQFIQPR